MNDLVEELRDILQTVDEQSTLIARGKTLKEYAIPGWLLEKVVEATAKATAALSAGEQMVMVPREPTPEMIEAFIDKALKSDDYSYGLKIADPVAGYRAMIAAVPIASPVAERMVIVPRELAELSKQATPGLWSWFESEIEPGRSMIADAHVGLFRSEIGGAKPGDAAFAATCVNFVRDLIAAASSASSTETEERS